MALTTYSDLTAAIADYAARSDLTAVIPTFITLSESAFNYGNDDLDLKPLRVREMETVATATPSSGDITLATDYLAMKSVTYQSDPKRVLKYATIEWLDENYATAVSGYPSFYTIAGSTLSIRPLGEADIQYVYYAKIPALSDSNTANWLLQKVPNAYLFGALYHLEVYLKNPEGAVGMRTLMRNELRAISGADKMSSAGSYVMRSAIPAQ